MSATILAGFRKSSVLVHVGKLSVTCRWWHTDSVIQEWVQVKGRKWSTETLLKIA